jgi:hypothetical protein
VIQAKHQKARKPSNRDPDLVGQRQPAAAFPLFLCDEYLDERAQLDMLGIVEKLPVRDVALQDCIPTLGKGVFQDLSALVRLQPSKHAAFSLPDRPKLRRRKVS